MRIIAADDLARSLTFPLLVEALRAAFRHPAVTPLRHHHSIAIAGEPDATLLLMPAWQDLAAETGDGFLGVKIVTVHPGNAARGRASVSGTYLLMAARTGAPLAVIDGLALTLWRTAAASALAASYLARADSTRLTMVGAGNLAPYLVRAHASVRALSDVLIWNRAYSRAAECAAALAASGFPVRATASLEEAVREADIVSCATLSSEPLVLGRWLKPGTHLDLVGAFTPEMRESDDEAVRRARIFVDTRDGALSEGGDIVQPLRAGVIGETAIRGDLSDLCRGVHRGREGPDEITLFKSVGTALEDLAAAALAYTRAPA